MMAADGSFSDSNSKVSLNATVPRKRKSFSGRIRRALLLPALLLVLSGCATTREPVDTQDGGERSEQVCVSPATSGALSSSTPSSTTPCGQFLNHAPVDPLCEDNGDPCIKRIHFEESDSLRIVSGPPGVYLEQEQQDNGQWVCRICVGPGFDPASYYELVTVSVVNSVYNPAGKEGRIYLQLVPPP
jgi:hypothetical protein